MAQIKVMTLKAAKLFMCDSELSGCARYIKGSIHSTTALEPTPTFSTLLRIGDPVQIPPKKPVADIARSMPYNKNQGSLQS